jgi:uncharacterized membrane protein
MFITYLMTFGFFIASYYVTQVIMDKLKEIDKEHLKQIGM